jgi:hypothetical protein
MRVTSNDHPSGIPVPGSDPATESRPVQYRQGDVLLVAIPLPDNAVSVPRRGSRIVLAEGEATGHAHVIAERDACEFRVGEERFVLVRSAAQLIHEEHGAIAVAPGAYRIVIQREYEPAPLSQNAWRRVID